MTELPAGVQARISAPADTPLEEAERFLRAYFGDEGHMDAVRANVACDIAAAPNYLLGSRFLTRALLAIEALLHDPPPAGTLLRLVFWDANHPLQDPSSEDEAKAWLRQVAEMLREELGDEPQRRC